MDVVISQAPDRKQAVMLAIELPEVLREHILNVCERRGVEVSTLVTELLTRFLPAAVYPSDHPQKAS